MTNDEFMKTPDTHGGHSRGWIGVDLDGTLAVYHGWIGPDHIGPPIERMVNRVGAWITSGKDVRIFTARVAPGKTDAETCRAAINEWLVDVFGHTLPITHEKDQHMIELWDDRAVQVIPNTGHRADSFAARLMQRFWLFLCRFGNHDWRDGPGSNCRTCGCRDDLFD
jgi:hypothetical protein